MLTNTKRQNPIVRRIQVLFLCILCSFCMQLKAQNVTISPQSGHLISGKTTNPNERGYVAGYGSYWVHNQLPLILTVSGTPYFTSNDVMTALSGGLKEYQGNLLIATLDFPEYACIALPRGYRIKHIEIKFAADDTFDVPLTPKVLVLVMLASQRVALMWVKLTSAQSQDVSKKVKRSMLMMPIS